MNLNRSIDYILSKVYVPIRYLLVAWLLVLSAVGFLDRTNISIAGVQIGQEFSISNTQLGWVFSAFLIGYAVFQIPAGMIVKYFGPRSVLTAAVLWWGVFTALTALVPPSIKEAVFILVFVRVALGAGEAAMYPAASQFVERWFPIEERGKANGLIFAGVGIGSGLTPPLVTAIMLRYGWRASFWFSAFVGILVGAVWLAIARNSPEEHPLVGNRELELIVCGRQEHHRDIQEANLTISHNRKLPWSRILKNKSILAVTASYFSYGYVAWIFFAWFYIYLAQVRGLNLKSSAVYSMLPFIAMTIGCLSGGLLSDWLIKVWSRRAGRCVLPAICLALTAFLLVLGSQVQSARMASVVLACGAGILYVAQSCYWSVTTEIAGEHASVVSGLMNMGAQLGGATTASLTPLIATHFGWEFSFITAALLSIMGAIAWLTVDPQSNCLQSSTI